MKNKGFKSVVCLAIASLLLSSCVGSFCMFNKLASWNKHATKSKFLNELIFIVISPAYAFCSAADVLVLNTIEFWSGSNPMASNIGKTQQVKGSDGIIYAVKTLKDGYDVTKPDGHKYSFKYDKKNDSWSMIENGKTTEIFRFNHDGTIQANINGNKVNLTLDEAGLYQARMAASGCTFFAMR